MGINTARNATAGTAIYLRCYPYDIWQMEIHRSALCQMAGLLGLPESTVHLDNGCRSRGPLPELERLVHQVTADFCRVLLVPGPFVFSLHAREARCIVRQLNAAGCEVLELPSLTRRTPALRRPEGDSADG